MFASCACLETFKRKFAHFKFRLALSFRNLCANFVSLIVFLMKKIDIYFLKSDREKKPKVMKFKKIEWF